MTPAQENRLRSLISALREARSREGHLVREVRSAHVENMHLRRELAEARGERCAA